MVCLYVGFPLVELCGVFLVADMSVFLWFGYMVFLLVCLYVGFPVVLTFWLAYMSVFHWIGHVVFLWFAYMGVFFGLVR